MKKKKKTPFEFGRKMQIPKTAQDTIPFIEAYDNGIFLSAPGVYTIIFAFSNLDYTLFRDNEQMETYEQYQRLLNALPADVSYQEFIMNDNVDAGKLLKTLIPPAGHAEQYGEVYKEYKRMMKDIVTGSDMAATEKIILGALSYKPTGVIENAGVLFKYYREIQKYFSTLKCTVKQLDPESVFAVFHKFYHPFDDVEFLLPQNIYSKGRRIKDYIAPSMFAIKPKDIEMGTANLRVMYVSSFDRECNDTLIKDLLDNSKRIIVSKHIKRLDKSVALQEVNKQILSAQDRVQKRMESNHKTGGNFIPFRFLDRLKELENLQERLAGSNCELFSVGVFVAFAAQSKEELEDLTISIKAIAMKHQVKLDILVRQQEKGMNSVLPMAVNYFSVQSSNSVSTHLLTDAASLLIPFSIRGYYSENGIFYGTNKLTNAPIILDRTDEMNANGFYLGSSGSGKSMNTKSELIDVIMKYPEDEVIVVDPENEYMPLVSALGGEIFKLSPDSKTKLNIFDTDLSYTEDGQNAISMKSEFIMSIVETAKGAALTANEKSIIDRCVKIIYKPFISENGNKDYLPCFEDFYTELQKQPDSEAHDIATSIELYVKGSFNNFSGFTNIDIKRKFLVIDIMDMGEQLRAVGLHVILEFLWQRVITNKSKGIRTWIWIDEFSMMFTGHETSSGTFFAKVYKRIRKHGGVITAITQNITEVLESKQAQTMISNAEFKILLQQKKQDLDVLIEMFQLSPSQFEYISTGERGTGLIICGKKVIPFDKHIPENNLIYKICSTNFKEQQKAEKDRKLKLYE